VTVTTSTPQVPSQSCHESPPSLSLRRSRRRRRIRRRRRRRRRRLRPGERRGPGPPGAKL
jgi:hypothetical protein